MKVLKSINEASEMLGIGRTKLYQLIGESQISTIKIGKRTLIHVDEIKRFISSISNMADGRYDEKS